MTDLDKYKIYFVNKYKWNDSAPMTTVSTFSTHAMAKLGIETNLIVQGNPDWDSNEILQSKYNLAPLANYKVLNYKKQKSLFRNSFYASACNYIKNDITNKQKIIITRSTTFLPHLIRLKNKLGAKVFFETHGYQGNVTPEGHMPPVHNKLISNKTNYFYTEKLFLNKCDGLICTSHPLKVLYESDFLKIPAVFIPHGSKIKPFNENMLSYNQRIVYYTGRFTGDIDAHTIFGAISLLRAENVKFVWIGLNESQIDELTKLAAVFGITENVDLKGWMSHTDMGKVLTDNPGIGLAAYKLSRDATSIICPTKIMDYYANSMPVVAPNLPIMQGIIQDGVQGLLYRVESPESLANAIKVIFSNKQIFSEFAHASYKTSLALSWDERAKKYVDFMLNQDIH